MCVSEKFWELFAELNTASATHTSSLSSSATHTNSLSSSLSCLLSHTSVSTLFSFPSRSSQQRAEQQGACAHQLLLGRPALSASGPLPWPGQEGACRATEALAPAQADARSKALGAGGRRIQERGRRRPSAGRG